jgi:hypothetical protein
MLTNLTGMVAPAHVTLAPISVPYTRTLSNQLPFPDVRVRIQLVSPFSASITRRVKSINTTLYLYW